MNFGTITSTLATLSVGAGVAGLILLLILLLPRSRARVARELQGQERLVIGVAWFVALVASAGSLYYSEVAGFVPCILCWYQRIAMYPLVLVLGAGALFRDPRVVRYGLPLAVVGLLIALYHVAIQFQPTLDAGMCTAGVPCSARYIAILGFISIPVMAGGGFLLITGLLAALWSSDRVSAHEGS